MSNDNYMSMEEISRRTRENIEALTPKKKKASVIGRGVAGAIVGGPVGAVVGSLSALDKNLNQKR